MSVSSIPDPSSDGYPSALSPTLLNVGASAPATSGTATATTGSTAAATAAIGKAAPTKYQTELQTLNQQDTAELLYASFLSPSDSLANGNAVLQQAAQLLGPPGTIAAAAPSTSTTPSTTTPRTTGSATTASSTDPANLPTVATLLGQSDSSANKALGAYVNAPAGASILDYQA